MAIIRVHLMNWHGVFNHLDIMLENRSVSPSTYYYINQWAQPALRFEQHLQIMAASEVIDANATEIINASSNTYAFDIKSNPDCIATAWVNNHHNMKAPVMNNHCAVAALWFLCEFANIPLPSAISAPINLKHLALSLLMPNYSAADASSPGRIMDNAKFYIHAKKTPGLIQQYSILLLQVCTTISLLALANNLTDIHIALLNLPHPGAHDTSSVSSLGLFKCNNLLATEDSLRDEKKIPVLIPE